jgi:nucleoside-diphosphate-sugar epimerase
MKSALVLGAGGFIGAHLVERLKRDGLYVRGADLKRPEFSESAADDFVLCDLRDASDAAFVIDRPFDEVYQLAADMGGAGYLFTGAHDADVLYNSAMINLNTVNACKNRGVQRLFFSSSACIYPVGNQQDPTTPDCSEDSAYPANPDSEYGWEKLFGERVYAAYARQHGMDVKVARYHNVFGPLGTWDGGREKVPAALCRKVAEAPSDGSIEIWGDGAQTRSFLYVDECIEGTVRLMRSAHSEPINIGSDEMVTINQLAQKIIQISGKNLSLRHVDGPLGVRGRNSDNRMIQGSLGWRPTQPLDAGLEKTYAWISSQVNSRLGIHTAI